MTHSLSNLSEIFNTPLFQTRKSKMYLIGDYKCCSKFNSKHSPKLRCLLTAIVNYSFS